MGGSRKARARPSREKGRGLLPIISVASKGGTCLPERGRFRLRKTPRQRATDTTQGPCVSCKSIADGAERFFKRGQEFQRPPKILFPRFSSGDSTRSPGTNKKLAKAERPGPLTGMKPVLFLKSPNAREERRETANAQVPGGACLR